MDTCKKNEQKLIPIYNKTQTKQNSVQCLTLIKVRLLLTVKGYNQIWKVSHRTATSCFHWQKTRRYSSVTSVMKIHLNTLTKNSKSKTFLTKVLISLIIYAIQKSQNHYNLMKKDKASYMLLCVKKKKWFKDGKTSLFSEMKLPRWHHLPTVNYCCTWGLPGFPTAVSCPLHTSYIHSSTNNVQL